MKSLSEVNWPNARVKRSTTAPWVKWESLIKRLGQFRVKTLTSDLNFRLWKDTVSFIAHALSISNTLPRILYASLSLQALTIGTMTIWKKNSVPDVEGELNIEHWQTNLKAGVENIKNYTYFNQKALPATEWR